MKKIIGCLLLLTLFAAAFWVGCNSDNAPLQMASNWKSGTGMPAGTASPNMTPSSTATETSTPAPYTTPQATPMAIVSLGSAASYAVLSYSGITNSGATTVCGSLGTFPSASVDGGVTVICSGTRQINTNAANTAETDLGTAYTDAMGRYGGVDLSPGIDVGGQTLYPGLYSDLGDLNVSSGNLRLDAQGYPNAVFIFQVTSNLTASAGISVILAGQTTANKVFWQVGGGCFLGSDSSFAGNIMARGQIALAADAVLDGRVLSTNAQVTLDNNMIILPPYWPFL